MVSTDHKGWAPGAAGARLEATRDSDLLVPGFSEHPEPEVATLPGYVWLEAPGKLLHVWADHLELREDPPGDEEVRLVR